MTQKKLDLKKIQKSLRKQGVSGWLFYGFQNIDPIAIRILKISARKKYTRRWFYLIPAKGMPRKLVHKIEKENLNPLAGRRLIYAGREELEEGLTKILKGLKNVAMQYSPAGAIPYISRVDAGTVELVKKYTAVVSSADLVQEFEATLTDKQLGDQKNTAVILKKLVDMAFEKISDAIRGKLQCGEYQIQQFISQKMNECGLITDSPCIVAINKNASNPHYIPSKEKHSPIKAGDIILIDLWAKSNKDSSVYADITWMGYVGERVPDKYNEIFEIVRSARDRGASFIEEQIKGKKTVLGWQADEAVRNYIKSRGYGKYFIHRTGHSIGLECHGNGANLDNLETKDERKIIANTCFSIEPGIYLPEFGIRSEINMYVGKESANITTQPVQQSIVPILKAVAKSNHP